MLLVLHIVLVVFCIRCISHTGRLGPWENESTRCVLRSGEPPLCLVFFFCSCGILSGFAHPSMVLLLRRHVAVLVEVVLPVLVDLNLVVVVGLVVDFVLVVVVSFAKVVLGWKVVVSDDLSWVLHLAVASIKERQAG